MSKPNISWIKIPVSRRQVMQGAGATALMVAGSGYAPAFAAGSTLKARAYADMRSLDPAFSQGIVDEEIQGPIYNKLVQYKPGSKWGWQLDAAAKIEQTDATHIKFALKNNIGFTNGFGAMTAEDVKFSFERIIDEELKSTNKPDMDALSHVEVTGEREGVIVLKNAFQPIWSITLPYATGNIVSKKAFESKGGRIDTEVVASSGPYMHASWQPKQKTTLVANPDWKGEKAAFDKIEIYPIDDEKSAEIAFEAGDIDFTRVSLASLERLKSKPPANSVIEEFPSLFYTWVGMNLDNPKLKNIKLRQAIQHAIDVPSIMQASYFDVAKPSTGIIAPGLLGNRKASLVSPNANVKKAKKLLKESGEKNVALKLAILNKQANVTTAQIIQANLAAIGIKVEIDLHEGSTFWGLGEDTSLELVLNRYSMTPDPYYASTWFTCEQAGVWNWERHCSEEFDAANKAAQSEGNDKKRAALYVRMQDIMEESGAYKFITHEATPNIYRKTINPGLRPDGLPLYRYFTKA